jgi:tryptophanyl-tRNA synthetase
MGKDRIVSGMRPTGKLHLGHFHGVLANWKELQDNYECFFFAADWHSLTTEYSNTEFIRPSIHEMLLDWLAYGINPEKCTLFVQSRVAQHAELNLILSMITPLSWLERNPTYKEQLDNLDTKELGTHGFLGYPVLMASDILVYKATRVPVGHDQLPHLEITREIARRFNYIYRTVFPEPVALLTETPKVLGLDGRKMSKSYGNAVFLSENEEDTRKKIMSMVTDVQRPRKSDPGEPDRCIAFTLHKLYTPEDKRDEIIHACRSAQIGCVECKKLLANQIIEVLTPFREKRKELEAAPSLIEEVLEAGSRKASLEAGRIMQEVRDAIRI